MLARPTRRATYHRALGSGELIPQNERELRRSEGSGMLIGDPLSEGRNASPTDNELWRAENSFLRMRWNSPFFFCPGLAGNFHLTSVRWSLRWLQGN